VYPFDTGLTRQRQAISVSSARCSSPTPRQITFSAPRNGS
jgi:hypothetical protein